MKSKLYIKWMHCISCEIILSKELSKLKWFTLKSISHKKWILEAHFIDENQLEEAIKLIEKHNFTVLKHEEKNNTTNSHSNNINDILLKIIILLVIGLVLYLSSLFFDVNKYLPTNNSISYTATAMMWIIASLSTCLAITWWIIIGFSKAVSKNQESLKNKVFVQWGFQLWRVLWFFFFGWILWLIWKTFSVNLQITTILTLLVSFLLLYIWLQILWFLPNITKLWIHLPKKLADKIMWVTNPKYAPIVWALTFFLPCWFTQTAQLIAISSWSFLTGWLIMWAFAVWTLPVLLLVWLSTSYFSWKKYPIVETILWSIIFIFWIITFTNAYNLIPSLFSSNQSNNEIITENIDFETVYYTHNWWNINWNEINLQSWKNYKVIITPERNGMWCMSTLTIPTISNEVHKVQAWIPIIYDLVDVQPWVHRVVCSSMWMVQWAIIIK